VFLLAWGRGVLDVIRAAAGRGSGEIALLDVEAAAGAEAKKIHAG
jgi:hypothetical protein